MQNNIKTQTANFDFPIQENKKEDKLMEDHDISLSHLILHFNSTFFDNNFMKLDIACIYTDTQLQKQDQTQRARN